MKLAVAFCCVILGCARANLLKDLMKAEWLEYKTEHRKEYATQHEELKRFQIYNENKLMIAAHNKRYAEGKESYEMGLNQFTDLTDEEFSRTMLMSENSSIRFKEAIDDDTHVPFIRPANFVAPKEVDWRKEGAVTPVKDQGRCNAAWAFAATGALEGAWYRKTKELISLSEQNLVDCDDSQGQCDGGDSYDALNFIRRKGGIESEAFYPYSASVHRCRYKHRYRSATVSIVSVLPAKDEEALRDAVASVGPVAVVLRSDLQLHHYKSGIYTSKTCARTPNHAVLVVGYGDGYWLVKNSWGPYWGESGYLRIARGQNMCNIALKPICPFA